MYYILSIVYRARERIHDVNFWMRSFLKNIGTLIEEDGEEVLPTQMQPLSIEDFNAYLSPYDIFIMNTFNYTLGNDKSVINLLYFTTMYVLYHHSIV